VVAARRPALARVVMSAALVAGAVPLVALAQASPAQQLIADNVEYVTTVPGATGGHSVIDRNDGDRLYVGAYGLGMRLFDISDARSPKVLGQYIPAPQQGQPDNDFGLRADAVPDATVMTDATGVKRHIVTLNGTRRTAGTQQTEFLDWTDPKNPTLLWRFPDAENGEAHNGDIVDSEGWWIPSGTTDLRIYDLAPLVAEGGPKAPERLFKGNPGTMWAESPHFNGSFPEPTGTGIHDIEIYDDRPTLLPQKDWKDQNGDGDVTQAENVVPRDIALVAEGGSYLQGNNTGSLYIIDITDPEAPVVLLRHKRAAADGKAQRYVHEAQFLDGQSDILITTDEDLHNGCDAGGIATFRVSEDLTSIDELAQWFIGTGTPAAMCSVHVMSTKDNYAFFGSYNAGLQVVDLTDPAKPVRGGRYIAPGANSWGALVNAEEEGYLTYVGDLGGRGLDVLDFKPAKPAVAGAGGNSAEHRRDGEQRDDRGSERGRG
jgi:hypothetical protein